MVAGYLILVVAGGLVEQGSVEKAFSGVHYKRCMRIHHENTSLIHGKFWITYMKMVEILILNYTSLREQNWDNYLMSLQSILPWMASYNNVHHSRYLPV